MTEAELAWAAGLIDGEGCITLQKSSAQHFKRASTDRFNLILKVTMCHELTIRRLHSLFGVGSFSSHAPKKGEKVSASYTWLCTTRQTEQVLRLVRPYIFTKEVELLVAEEYLALPLAKRGGKKGSKRVPPELQAAREACYNLLRKLKTRSQFKGEKPGRKSRRGL